MLQQRAAQLPLWQVIPLWQLLQSGLPWPPRFAGAGKASIALRLASTIVSRLPAEMPAPCLNIDEPCSSAYALATGSPSCRAASFFWPCARAHRDQHNPVIKPGTLTAPAHGGFSGMSVHADCAGYDSVGMGQALAEDQGVDERFDLECGEKLALHLRHGWGLGFSLDDVTFEYSNEG
jgi:hypothetical protein